MQNKHYSTTAGDISRDFAYEEKPRLSPTWQLIIDIGETLILTVVMFMVIRFAVQDFQVEGTSMLPTLQNNQFVLVDKLTYNFSQPQRGDVIVFEYPLDHTKNYIKRVIGLPGDHVTVNAAGIVRVNGKALSEPYVNDLDNFYGDRDVTLGANQYYVLGDNRGGSSDSREWGPVNKSEIIGKATLVYWPFSAFHFLPNEHSVFNGVPSSNTSSTISPLPNTTLQSQLDTPFSALTLFGALPVSAAIVRARKRTRR
jgi:signal peptidase I